jgi:hypothetical protein
MNNYNRIYRCILGFAIILLLLTCNAKSKNTAIEKSECEPNFEFNAIEHYKIEIEAGSVYKDEVNKEFSEEEIMFVNLVENNYPTETSELFALNDLQKLGFSKKNLSRDRFKYISNIFCQNRQVIHTKFCLPVYRDILIFKKENEITGFAKICFTCNQSYIVKIDEGFINYDFTINFQRLSELLQ